MKGSGQIQTIKQGQKVNAQQIQFLNFLFLNQQELDVHINQELLENPFLEMQNESDFSESQTEEFESEDSLLGEMRVEEVFSTDDLDNEDAYYKLNSPTSMDNSEWKDLQMERHTVFADIEEIVMDQVKYKNLTEEQMDIAHFLIYSTNEKGFLDTDISTITDNLGFATGKFHNEEEILSIKKIVNACEPIGYACFNLQDYLFTCVSLIDDIHKEVKKAALIVIQQGFQHLSSGTLQNLTENFDFDSEILEEVLSLITKTKPYPTKGFGDSWNPQSSNVIPDYQISFVDDKLRGEIVTNRIYNLTVNQEYANSMRNTTRNGTNTYISGKLKSAYSLIDAIEQREETMRKVIEAITYLQEKYLLTGDNSQLRPMILKDVAEYIDMTISTVSRVTSYKYARTPIGLINLKDLFTEAIELDNGERKSNREVQEMVVQLLRAEDKSNPLSDFDIRNTLKMEGINLTRRTITKYRTAANIPSSKERKVS